MTPANVKLSKNEMLLVCDPQFILTKNVIIQKVYELFGLLANDFVKHSNEIGLLSKNVLSVSPKIYRGEQYKELPYVMLDYPRYFSREHTLAIRCFFWWGNFFSINMHLSGDFLKMYGTSVLANAVKNNWKVSIHNSPWEHHFEENNFIDAASLNLSAMQLQEMKFLKIAKNIPLAQWDCAYDFFSGNFKILLQMLGEENF